MSHQVFLLKQLHFLKNNKLFDEIELNNKIKFFQKKLKRKIDIRSLVISKTFGKMYLLIHKGYLYKKIYLNEFIIGYKLGEFSFTRKPFKYPIKKKRKNFLRR